MKKTVVKILKVVFYPVIWCHDVIMNAPMINCDNELL